VTNLNLGTKRQRVGKKIRTPTAMAVERPKGTKQGTRQWAGHKPKDDFSGTSTIKPGELTTKKSKERMVKCPMKGKGPPPPGVPWEEGGENPHF